MFQKEICLWHKIAAKRKDVEQQELQVFLKGLHMDLLTDDSLTLSSSTGETTCRIPGVYMDELSYLVLGQWLEKQLSPRQKCWQKPLFILLSPHPSQHANTGG